MTNLDVDKLKFRNSYVVIKRTETDKFFPGTSILLPELQLYDSPLAVVLQVGPGKQKRHDLQEFMDLSPGDEIVIDGIFTDEKRKIAPDTYFCDVKEIEAVISWEEVD